MARRTNAPIRQLLARWRALVTAHGRAQGAAVAGSLAAVDAAWRRLDNPYDPQAERAFAEAAAQVIRAGRGRSNDLVDAHMRRILASVDVDLRVHPVARAEPRGLPVEDVMARAAKQYRWEISEGRAEAEARESGARRARLMAETDVAMAARDAFAQIVESVPEITGYRRVVHPELSAGGTCGLCIAAATRVYQKADLLPLHGRCKCTVLPIVEGVPDLAQTINEIDLDDLYVRIGETRREELSKFRIRVEDHGETGPTLIVAEHHFRGPEEAAADADEDTPIGTSAA